MLQLARRKIAANTVSIVVRCLVRLQVFITWTSFLYCILSFAGLSVFRQLQCNALYVQKRGQQQAGNSMQLFNLIQPYSTIHSSACGLPSFMPVFSIQDGSFSPCTLADFRLLCLFSSFRTEVTLHARLRTSVFCARFHRLGRKFLSMHACGLPSFMSIFSIQDGSSFLDCLSIIQKTAIYTVPLPWR